MLNPQSTNKMKKILIAMIMLACLQMAQAQTNEDFIYKEIDQEFQTYYPEDRKLFDINNDSIHDFFFDTFTVMYQWGGWLFCGPGAEGSVGYSLEEYNGTDNVFRDLDIPLNDNELIWSPNPLVSEFYPIHVDTIPFKVGLRFNKGGVYYYGWVEAYFFYERSSWFKLKVSRTCYCTIPNYPLRWGQTSLAYDLTENESAAFATLCPNPTNGLVTITGENLRQAEMFNLLGQRVAEVHGGGNPMTVDISGLPAGLYFVNVIDEQGRKCVRKVVKE